MAREGLLPVKLEVALTVVYDYLVVHGLTCKVLTIRVHCCGRNCMHIWLRDVLRDNWDAKLPDVHFFVVGGAYEAPAVLYKGQCVNRTKVLFVLLNDVFRIRVKLQDLFVRTPCQEDMLLVICRVELDAERCLTVREASDDLARFCVP